MKERLKLHYFDPYFHRIPLILTIMKRFFILLVIGALLGCAYDAQAQNKPSSGKKSTKTSKNKKPTPKPKPQEVELPANSGDCIFAIELQPDIQFGPTVAPKGGGRIQDVMADKTNPWVFDYEHNSTWYKFVVPYNGVLDIRITPNNIKDDYDFIVFKYTDNYFSNRIIEGKVKPIASCLSQIDTSSKTNTMGMTKEATKNYIPKASTEQFVKSISVRKGEIYYIALDNRTGNGGHSIKVGIVVDSFEPMVSFYDSKLKKNVEVDLLILEKNTDNRPIVKNPKFRGGKIKFVPGFNYTLYAKKDGYFSVYKDFNSNIFKEDTILRIELSQAVKGTRFQINNIYFDDNAELLPESDTVLMNFISMFRNHPGISFQIKGLVPSYGIDIERDIQLSVSRAQSVKNFFVRNGISSDRITIAGMTQNEIKRSAAAALNKGQAFRDTKAEILITGVAADE